MVARSDAAYGRVCSWTVLVMSREGGHVIVTNAASMASTDVPDMSPKTTSGCDTGTLFPPGARNPLTHLEHATYCWNTRSLEPMTYGEGMMKRSETMGKPLAIGPSVTVTVAVAVGARAIDRPRTEAQSKAAAWFWSTALTIVLWSVSYLARQPGVATSALSLPFSPLGDFALEGALLALGWLALLAAACLAVLTGAARIEE